MHSEMLEPIETRIAYLERANSELSEVVFRQQQQIDALQAQIRTLSERVAAARAESVERPPEDERPPHY